MNKKTLQTHYDFLRRTYEDFTLREGEYKRGRNAKIRNSALRTLEVCLMRFESYVTQHPELYDFLTGERGTDYGRAIIWDEFKSIRYFSRDMAEALRKIERLLSE